MRRNNTISAREIVEHLLTPYFNDMSHISDIRSSTRSAICIFGNLVSEKKIEALSDFMVNDDACINYFIFDSADDFLYKYSNGDFSYVSTETFHFSVLCDIYTIASDLIGTEHPHLKISEYYDIATSAMYTSLGQFYDCQKYRGYIVMGGVYFLLFYSQIRNDRYFNKSLSRIYHDYCNNDISNYTPFYSYLIRSIGNKIDERCWITDFESAKSVKSFLRENDLKQWSDLSKYNSPSSRNTYDVEDTNNEPETSVNIEGENIDQEKLETMKLVFKTYFCDTVFLPKLKECIDKYVHKKADLKKVYLALKQLDFFKDVDQNKWKAFAEMLLVCNLYDKEVLCMDDKDNQIKKLADSIRLGRKGPCEALILSINQIRDKNAWSNCTH